MPANALPALPHAGPGIPGGYRVASKNPIDVRLTFHTTAQRNNETQTYPGMPVAVNGPMVMVAGVPTYPQLKLYVCKVDKEPNYGGPTTADQDWELIGAGAAASGANNYKGPVSFTVNDAENGTDISPNLNDAAIRASLKAGDFYKVAGVGTTFPFNVDGITELDRNDTLFWNGVSFDRFENTNPNAVEPLYEATEGSTFLADVEQIVRNMNVREYQVGVGYKRGDVVYFADSDGTSTFLALRDLGAAESFLLNGPLTGRWLMLSTTNPDLMPGMPVGNDTAGKEATGAYTPTTRTAGTYLSPEEIDSRIAQYGGGGYRPIVGGNARTFATANINEIPAN